MEIVSTEITEIGDNSGTKVDILCIRVNSNDKETIKYLKAMSRHVMKSEETNIVQLREATIYKIGQLINESKEEEVKEYNQRVQQQRTKNGQDTEIIIANLPTTINSNKMITVNEN